MSDAQRTPARRFLSYEQIVGESPEAFPDGLRVQRRLPFEHTTVEVERYVSRRYHDLEKRHLWSRVWQFACREEHIPETGDQVVYEIAGRSILIVRAGEGCIKAFPNSCLHRGRQLREFDGRAPEIRCPFHGFTWNLSGAPRTIPCANEFPGTDRSYWTLPELKVERWGGFVFVNPDPQAASLASFLGDLPAQFDRWRLEDRYVSLHVAKRLRCNWKVAQEAFMEAFHVSSTHPQHAVYLGDRQSRYDVFGNFSRAISPLGVPSLTLDYSPAEQDIVDAMMDRTLDEPIALAVRSGQTARELKAHLKRESLRTVIGDRVDTLTEAELADALFYTVFPNFHPWGSYNEIVYRFRPNGDDHRTSLMEVMLLSPFKGQRPAPAPVRSLDYDESWTTIAEFGSLGRVFDQDSFNMPKIQIGLESSGSGRVNLTAYQETKIRHFYELHRAWLDGTQAGSAERPISS